MKSTQSSMPAHLGKEEFYQSFQQSLRTQRLKAGLTQKELAYEIGNSSAIQKYENARKIPKTASVARIACVLQLSIAQLLGIEHRPEVKSPPFINTVMGDDAEYFHRQFYFNFERLFEERGYGCS